MRYHCGHPVVAQHEMVVRIADVEKALQKTGNLLADDDEVKDDKGRSAWWGRLEDALDDCKARRLA